MKTAVVQHSIEAFEADLLSGDTATRVLERWCGARVHAALIDDETREVGPERRARLGVGADEPLGYRRIRLMCGGVILSEAENWFVPARLTAAMRAALADTDTPFGAVIAPFGPVRRTLAVRRPGHDPILGIDALVTDRDGRALAEVSEVYRRACLG